MPEITTSDDELFGGPGRKYDAAPAPETKAETATEAATETEAAPETKAEATPEPTPEEHSA